MSKWTRNFDNAPKYKAKTYYEVIIEDLEKKNKVLHTCTYTAHSAIAKLLGEIETLDIPQIGMTLSDLKTELENILMSGTEEKIAITTAPGLEIAT